MINPMTEKLGPLLDFVRLKLEDNGVPSVPHSVSSAVDVASNNLVSVADTVDSYASNGIDLLTENVPTLKEETPVFIEETRSSINTFWANIYNFAMTFELFKMFVMTLAVFLDISFDEKLPEKEENRFPKKEINELQKADSKIKTKSKTKVNFFSKVKEIPNVEKTKETKEKVFDLKEEANQKTVEKNNNKIAETIIDDKIGFEAEHDKESNSEETFSYGKEQQNNKIENDKSDNLAMSNEQLSDTDAKSKNSPKPPKFKKNISKVFIHKRKSGDFDKLNEPQMAKILN